jgi:hypothetical protein
MLCRNGFSLSTFKRSKALPDGTQELFERIFGERHFSLKCVVRSAVFSLGAMVFLGILVFLIDSKAFFEMENDALATPRFLGFPRWLPWSAVWLPWSIVIDYVSVFKDPSYFGDSHANASTIYNTGGGYFSR